MAIPLHLVNAVSTALEKLRVQIKVVELRTLPDDLDMLDESSFSFEHLANCLRILVHDITFQIAKRILNKSSSAPSSSTMSASDFFFTKIVNGHVIILDAADCVVFSKTTHLHPIQTNKHVYHQLLLLLTNSIYKYAQEKTATIARGYYPHKMFMIYRLHVLRRN